MIMQIQVALNSHVTGNTYYCLFLDLCLAENLKSFNYCNLVFTYKLSVAFSWNAYAAFFFVKKGSVKLLLPLLLMHQVSLHVSHLYYWPSWVKWTLKAITLPSFSSALKFISCHIWKIWYEMFHWFKKNLSNNSPI